MALRLGYASPARMLSEMRPSELGMWAAFYTVDPWTEERADMRAGIVASTLANVHRGRNTRAFSAADFMPFRERPDTLAQDLRAFLMKQPSKKAG